MIRSLRLTICCMIVTSDQERLSVIEGKLSETSLRREYSEAMLRELSATTLGSTGESLCTSNSSQSIVYSMLYFLGECSMNGWILLVKCRCLSCKCKPDSG
jgi:hypothetical protein